MPGLRIRDMSDRGFLEFDLADLLAVIGEPARRSRWRCSVEECISLENARRNLEAAYNSPSGLSGRKLLALAAETSQVIDGVFRAFHPGDDAPWIRLEAIDSTYWEVFATDSGRLAPFESRFRDVEHIREGAA